MARPSRARLALLGAAAAMLLAPSAASAGIFGTTPIDISHTPGGGQANGESGSPAISGDDRKARYVAFWSDASDLVRGDSNGKRDIFLWSRPKGRRGLTLPSGSGSVQRISVSNSGQQANGDSFDPSIDGSVTRVPHCVAFQSQASNLAPGDRDTTADIFVRDLRARKTYLVSRHTPGAASNPAIDGSCRNVAFVAGNRVMVAPVRGGRPRAVAPGRDPNFARDGSALTWVQGTNVMVRRAGHIATVGQGDNPTVTDHESGQWAVSYQSGGRVLVRILKASGGPKRTIRVGSGANGGITVYGSRRGIVTFFDASDLYYFNEHSGNSDDLAHMNASIDEVVTSARANFVAFSSGGNVWFKHLVDGQAL
jgi:hypothetical protein